MFKIWESNCDLNNYSLASFHLNLLHLHNGISVVSPRVNSIDSIALSYYIDNDRKSASRQAAIYY